jgi:periplasmic copper chaperone A
MPLFTRLGKPIVSALLLTLASAASLADAATGSVRILDAWMREPPPGRNIAALYMILRNDSNAAARIIGVQLENASSASIHQSVEQEGMMRMRAVPVLDVPAGFTVALAPGGYHIMVFGLKRVWRSGERLPFCLMRDNGDRICAKARVKGLQEQANG